MPVISQAKYYLIYQSKIKSSLFLPKRNSSIIGPLQLESRDQKFSYGLYLKECQKWKEQIENTIMAKFEAAGIKE